MNAQYDSFPLVAVRGGGGARHVPPAVPVPGGTERDAGPRACGAVSTRRTMG